MSLNREGCLLVFLLQAMSRAVITAISRAILHGFFPPGVARSRSISTQAAASSKRAAINSARAARKPVAHRALPKILVHQSGRLPGQYSRRSAWRTMPDSRQSPEPGNLVLLVGDGQPLIQRNSWAASSWRERASCTRCLAVRRTTAAIPQRHRHHRRRDANTHVGSSSCLAFRARLGHRLRRSSSSCCSARVTRRAWASRRRGCPPAAPGRTVSMGSNSGTSRRLPRRE